MCKNTIRWHRILMRFSSFFYIILEKVIYIYMRLHWSQEAAGAGITRINCWSQQYDSCSSSRFLSNIEMKWLVITDLSPPNNVYKLCTHLIINDTPPHADGHHLNKTQIINNSLSTFLTVINI